jgi:hypothetical protein
VPTGSVDKRVRAQQELIGTKTYFETARSPVAGSCFSINRNLSEPEAVATGPKAKSSVQWQTSGRPDLTLDFRLWNTRDPVASASGSDVLIS